MCFFEDLSTTFLLFVPPSLSFAIDLLLPPQYSVPLQFLFPPFLSSIFFLSPQVSQPMIPFYIPRFYRHSFLYLHLQIWSLEQQMIVNMWSLSFCVWNTSLRIIFPRNRRSPANSIIKERMKRIKTRKKIKVSFFVFFFLGGRVSKQGFAVAIKPVLGFLNFIDYLCNNHLSLERRALFVKNLQ